MNDHELGKRIALWRKRRGLTQQLLADRLGRSISWIRKIEAGSRSAARLSTLDAICQVLRVDLYVLIGEEPHRGASIYVDDEGVGQIRAALERYNLFGVQRDHPMGLNVLRRQMEYLWTAFEMADYDVIGHLLPPIIVEAQDAHAVLNTVESAHLLAEMYQISATTLRKLGEYSLSWLAGDRGVTVAQQIDDLGAVAATGFRVANALLSMGRTRAARSMCISLVDRLESELAKEAHRALYGHILLQGAMAAASEGHDADVRTLFIEAERIAEHVSDGSNHYRLEFGKTNVALHKVAALVVMGEGGMAVETALAIPLESVKVLRRERRAALMVDVARGYSQWGKRDEALGMLLEAETLASAEVRCRPIAQATIADLLTRAKGNQSSQLLQLAARAGVRV